MSSGSDLAEKKTVLVTGAAGLVGSKVIELLASAGHSVVALYRHTLPQSYEGVFPVCSDLSSVELLGAPLRGVDTVIHLAWESNFVGLAKDARTREDFQKESQNISALNNLLLAMEKARTSELLFLSSLGVEKDTSSAYALEKYFAEHAVLNSSVPVKVVLRSAPVVSEQPANLFLESIKKLLVLPGFYPLPRCDRIFEPVCLSDLAASVVSQVQAVPNQPMSLVEVVGKERFTIDTLFKVVIDAFSRSGKIPISPAIAAPIIPLLERDRDFQKPGPKIQDFIELARAPSKNSKHHILLDQIDNAEFSSVASLLSQMAMR